VKTRTAKSITYHLELTEEEVRWLEAYVQNAHDPHESQLDAQMRQVFFEALHNLGGS